MVIVAFSVLGNCRTGRLNTARTPSTRISRLTTVASTSLRMKRSVNFICCRERSLLDRLGIRVERRLHRIVDVDRHAVAQLELAAGHDLVAFLQALEDRD